jgi:hypothetical protein
MTQIAGLIILIGAVVLGFYEGWKRPRFLVVILSGTTIMGVSNLAANWRWFVSDASTWAQTYGTGLLQTGVVSLTIHLVPFVIAYLIGRRYQGQRKVQQQ